MPKPGPLLPRHWIRRRDLMPVRNTRFRVLQNEQYLDKKKQLSITNFKSDYPAVFKKAFLDIPAIEKWFQKLSERPEVLTGEQHLKQHDQRKQHQQRKLDALHKTFRYPQELNTAYLEQYGNAIVPLELTRVSTNGSARNQTFERFEAPLSLLLQHMSAAETQDTSLYLAQHSLADLPAPLQEDLPTPSLFLPHLKARGDIYASSLWMGRPPTRTPLHRDPNPNIFVQLAGKKTIRLMKPEVGRGVYEIVRQKVHGAGGDANMRGEEMMQGGEMEGLEDAVWNDDPEVKMADATGVETTLRSGDALYIPHGWWHAVRGLEGAQMLRSTGGSAERSFIEIALFENLIECLRILSRHDLISTLTVASEPSTHVPIDLVPGTISTSLMTRSIPISASLSSESQSSSTISVGDFRTDIQSPVSHVNLHAMGLILKCFPTIPSTVYAVLLMGISVSKVVSVAAAR